MKSLTVFKAASAALIGLVLATSQAEAARRSFNLDYRGQQVRNGQVALIKRDIERAYGVDTRNMELIGATIQVKSIDRFGSVQLRTGNKMSERRAVYTRPGDWVNPADYSYDRVQLYGGGYESYGDWRVEFFGTALKIGRISIDVEDNLRPSPGPGPVPRPRPPGPGPGPRPGQRYAEVNCLSENYRPASCPVNFTVTQVVLLQQFSDARGQCIEGQSFFSTQSAVEVYHGCRGRFAVYGY
ncbi:MAG: DUF3011 domain-containing protein [Bdellovibrionota bacterium]